MILISETTLLVWFYNKLKKIKNGSAMETDGNLNLRYSCIAECCHNSYGHGKILIQDL